MVEGKGWVDTSDGGCATGWAVVGRPRRGADGLRSGANGSAGGADGLQRVEMGCDGLSWVWLEQDGSVGEYRSHTTDG